MSLSMLNPTFGPMYVAPQPPLTLAYRHNQKGCMRCIFNFAVLL